MASASLSRTQVTATNRNIFTVSMWVKQSRLGSQTTAHQYMDFYVSADIRISIYQMASDQIAIYMKGGGYADNIFYTTAVYRDTSAWYHFVWRFDTTQSTAADRVRMYVNGEQVTSFVSTNYPAQNFNLQQGTSSYTQYVGRYGGNTNNNFDGQMAHVHFTDGYSYAPTVFGETDATTGIWKPKTSPSVTYGNNGFFLKFDNSGNMGLDSSGNSNNLTTSGTIIQNKDTPSNVFATMDINTKNANASVTLTNVGSTVNVSNQADNCTSTLRVSSGKYYWEGKQTVGSLAMVGIRPEGMHYNQSNIFNLTGTYQGYYYYGDSGNIRPANTSYGATFGVNDIIGFALDLDNNKLYFSKNGTWQNSGDPTSGSTGTGAVSIATSGLTWGFSFTSGGGSDTFQMNFGNGYFGTTAVSSAQNPDDGIGIFEYDVPAGYRALCTKSINEEEYS